MSDRKLTVTFELSEPQWETVKKVARFEKGWRWCDLQIRHNGEFKNYEAGLGPAFGPE